MRKAAKTHKWAGSATIFGKLIKSEKTIDEDPTRTKTY